MADLRILQKVELAYRQASARKIACRAYTRATAGHRLALWLFSALFVLALGYMVFLKENAWLGGLLVAVAMLPFGVSFERAVRSAYRPYFEDYGDLIHKYSRNREFLRYLIFRDLLLREAQLSPRTAEEARSMLFLKDEDFGKQILQHPFTVILVGFLTAILGGSASIQAGWTSGIMPVVVLLILIVLFVNFQISSLIETPMQREKELDRFLRWLAADEAWSNIGLDLTSGTLRGREAPQPGR